MGARGRARRAAQPRRGSRIAERAASLGFDNIFKPERSAGRQSARSSAAPWSTIGLHRRGSGPRAVTTSPSLAHRQYTPSQDPLSCLWRSWSLLPCQGTVFSNSIISTHCGKIYTILPIFPGSKLPAPKHISSASPGRYGGEEIIYIENTCTGRTAL